MKIKEFKEWFNEFASGIPVTGTNGSQWRALVAKVEQLEVEAPVVAPKSVAKEAK